MKHLVKGYVSPAPKKSTELMDWTQLSDMTIKGLKMMSKHYILPTEGTKEKLIRQLVSHFKKGYVLDESVPLPVRA
jgi:predicted RNA methylase